MNAASLEDEARGVLAAALTGGDWVGALEPVMSRMNALGGGPARVVPPDLSAIPTQGVRTLFADFRAGDRPPLAKGISVPVTAQDAFVADYMSPTYAARTRHPFYNEFLRPRRACHQAVAFLNDTDAGPVSLLVFRDERQGRFEPDDLAAFARILPYLRSTSMVSRTLVEIEARRRAAPFERRGEPVLFLGPDGGLLDANAAGERAICEMLPVVRKRLTAAWPADQARLDSALTVALVAGRPGLVTLRARSEAPFMALVLPVSGEAKDLFRATSAIVVLIDPARRQTADEAAIGLLKDAADLTNREVALVRRVGIGRSPADAAADLGIAVATTRVHLKASFAKLGVHTQAELVALIHRLR